jgi:signal transduction histidine kinase
MSRVLVIDINNLQTFNLLASLPAHCLLFLTFRKRVWKNVFLQATVFMYGLVYIGIGNYIGDNFFPENLILMASIVSIAVTALTLPPLLFMLRRMYSNRNTLQAAVFWRLVWLVPLSFFMIIFLGGNYLRGSFDSWFFIVRVVSYGVLLMLCYLFDVIARQISEAEAVKRKAEEAAAEIDFYRKMSHSLRTPLTVISTNIQTAKRRPNEADELLTHSQAEIMKMAAMISDALKDGEKGAGE